MKCSVYEMYYLWNVQSMKCPIYEMSLIKFYCLFDNLIIIINLLIGILFGDHLIILLKYLHFRWLLPRKSKEKNF